MDQSATGVHDIVDDSCDDELVDSSCACTPSGVRTAHGSDKQ
jgi:hypothetical protein